MQDVQFRQGTAADDPTAHVLFRDSVEDLLVRLALQPPGPHDPVARAHRWETLYRPLMAHLTATAEAYRIAEDESGMLGYARTINRGGLRELTEIFVAPRAQGLGVGRELLAQAFPTTGADTLAIIATLDVRAQNRYMQSGCYPQFPIIVMFGTPTLRQLDTGLHAEPLDPSGLDAPLLAPVDTELLGHRRDVDHAWLATQRKGWRYLRAGKLVGYGYVGPVAGPVAAIDRSDVAPILNHLETQAALAGQESLEWDVPGVNRAALAHLKANGFKADSWFTFFMTNHDFGNFDRYIISSPTFFL